MSAEASFINEAAVIADNDDNTSVKRRVSTKSPGSEPGTRRSSKAETPVPVSPLFADTPLTDRQRKLQIAKALCFGCLKSCSSSFGLMLAVIGYSVLGGYIFYVLEAGNVITDCQTRRVQYIKQESKIVNRLLDVANGADVDTMHESYIKLLRRFRKIVYEVDYTGDNCEMIGKEGGVNNPWSVSGAAMFAVTITSTVGYGHIAPKTFWGKMVCIAYAVLGIPLMLLFLANIGDVLADFFRWFYSKICCCGCCRKDEPGDEDDKVKVAAEGNENEAFQSDEDDASGGRSRKSSVAGGSEAGKDDVSAAGDGVRSVRGDDGEEKEEEDADSLAESVAISFSAVTPEPPAKGPVIVDEDDDIEDEDDVTIPLTVTLGVLFGYIMLGAVLFGVWEGWSMGDAAYFSFVTLSTIGFGDFVPGTDSWDDPAVQVNLIMGSVYVVFGMAILSMCFTLIQDELEAKFSWIGKKLGLIDTNQ